MAGWTDGFPYPEALNPRLTLQLPFVPKEGGMEGQLNSWLLQRNTHLLTPGTFLQHRTGLHFFLFLHTLCCTCVVLLFCVHLIYGLSMLLLFTLSFFFSAWHYLYYITSLFYSPFSLTLKLKLCLYFIILFFTSLLSFYLLLCISFSCHFRFPVCCLDTFVYFFYLFTPTNDRQETQTKGA